MTSNEYEYLQNNPLAGDPDAALKNDFNEEELGFWGTVGDIAMGVPRGVAGAVEGVLELPTIFGFDYDIPDNFGLGESKTMAGGIVDGIVNFGAGFMMGGAGVGAKAAGALKATKAGKGLMGGTPRAFLKGGTIRNELVTAGLQGAAVDLMFFKGNEGRLSDLIQSSPSLANPISEFLASDEEDSELTGRLKNAIEGLGIGLAVDSLLIPLRALKAGRKKFEETGDVNKANEEAAKVYTEEEIRPWMESFGVDRQAATALAAHAAHFGLGPEHMIVGQAADGARLFQVDTTKFFHTTYDGLLKFNDNDSLANVKKSIGGKNDEWEFTGLNELLESNPNATVGDAKAHFKPVEVEEQIFSKDNAGESFSDAEADALVKEVNSYSDAEIEDLIQEKGAETADFDGIEEMRDWLIDDTLGKGKLATKYDEYTPQGIENYRELSVRWKGEGSTEPSEIPWTPEGVPTPDKPKMPSELVHSFGDNTMFHVRFGDKIEGDKKILYVFEMQSDWTRQGQTGRWEGVPKATNEELSKLSSQIGDVEEKSAAIVNEMNAMKDMSSDKYESLRKERDALFAEQDKLNKIYDKLSGPETPAHPFAKTWLNSAVERMFKLAAEEGYDGIRFADVESAREVTGLGARKVADDPAVRGTDQDPAHVIYGRQIPKLAKKFAKKNGVEYKEGQGLTKRQIMEAHAKQDELDGTFSNLSNDEIGIALANQKDTFMFDTKSPHMGSRAATLRPTPLFQDTSVQQGRSAALQDAAATIGKKGGVTASEYQTLVNELKPVAPYKFIPPAATAPQMKSALKKGQIDKVNAPIKDGQQVGLRLDIPAYSNHGTWVPTIHGADGKPISHRAVAVVTDATFGAKEKQSLRVAKGGAKSPFATIDGAFENGTKKATMAEAKAALNDPEYVQVGFDPERHSYFYDRTTQEPIIGAERVIQVGPLVLAKKPKYGKKSDFLFQDEGKVVNPYDTAKGVTEFGEDGKAYVRGLNNPDVSTAVHEMGHVVRRRYYSMPEADGGFTAAERTILDEWVGATDGRWDVNAEEKFARGFELYVREGALPEGAPQGLRGVFQTLATAMLDIYRRVAGSAVDVKIDPKVKQVFDDLFERGGKGAEPGGQPAKLFQEPDNTGAARKAKAEKAAQRAPEYDGNVVNEDGSVVYLDSTASDIGEVHSIPSDLEGRPDLVSSDDTARDLFIKARDLRRNDERFKAMSYEEKLIAAEQRAHTIYETSNVEGTEALAEIATSGQRVFEDSLTHIYAMQDVEAALLRQHKRNIIAIRDLKKEGKEPSPQMIAQAMVVEKQLGAASDSVITNMESLARAFASRRRKGKGSAITTTELEGKYVDGVETEEFTKLVGAIENGKVDGEKWYEQTVLAIEKGDVNAMRVSNSRYKMGWGHVLMEAYYSSLLSGVKTQTVNAMGSWMNTIIMPIEKMIGRALVTDANAKQQLAMLANLPRQAMESLGMIPVVLREGSSQLDPGGRSSLTDATGMHRGRTNVAEIAGLDNTAAGTVMNWLHGVGTFPLRALGAVDEFAKQTNYRAHVLADLTQKAKDVHPSDGVAQQKWVQKKFDLMTEDGKMYSARTMWNKAERMAREQVGEAGDDAKYLIREKATELFNDMWDNDLGNIAKEGLRLAREATFTSANNPNLGANPASRAIQGAGAALQRGLAKHPVGRLIVPFVNTPTNLATWFVDRQFSPMFDGWKLVKSKLKPEYDQAIYGGDPNLKADAVGRLVTGSMMTVTALGAITAGKLTGGGPRDSQQRQIWLGAGNQPYSIKTDDGWISYKRLDPWASFLGVTADLVEGMAHQAENEDDSLPLDIFMATTMAFSRNLREKTYLQGITQAVQALTNPEVHGARWIRGFASAGMPTLIKDMNSDPYYREIRSATDQWLSRTPGMSDKLMPRRDLLGAPIEKPGYWAPGGLEFMSPFAYSQVSSDVVKKELASREHGFSPPQANKNGVDLREVVSKSGQTSYDRWQELHSTVKLNGRTLREALEHLIESPRYQRMVETPDYDPKVGELRKVLSKYRSRAYREVEKEFPQLLESRIQTKRRQAAARYGRNIQDILNY